MGWGVEKELCMERGVVCVWCNKINNHNIMAVNKAIKSVFLPQCSFWSLLLLHTQSRDEERPSSFGFLR